MLRPRPPPHRVSWTTDAAARFVLIAPAAPRRGAGRRAACCSSARCCLTLRHRPRVLPAGGCRPDHHVRPRPVQPAPRRQREARRRGREVPRATTSRADEREMIVSRDGRSIRTGRRPTPPTPASRTPSSACSSTMSASLSAQEYAIKLRHAFDRRPALRRPARQLRHRRHGVDGAELRRLLADRHPDRGRQPRKQSHEAGPATIRNRVRRAFAGAADVRVLQRLDAPYLIIDVDRQKAADVGLSAARRDPAGGGRHELQRVDQPQLLDRRQERQPVLRGGAVPGESQA